MQHRCKQVCLLMIVLLLLPSLVPADDSEQESKAARAQSGYRVRSTVIGAAGIPGASAGFGVKGTLGQSTPPGAGSSSDKALYAGFWKDVLLGLVTEVEETPAYRDELLQNYPNPFNPVTTIEYSVSGGGYVELTIFNVLGQRVRTLVNENKVPGRYRAIWDGRNDGGRMVATGMYFYRLRIDSFVSVKKMVLIR